VSGNKISHFTGTEESWETKGWKEEYSDNYRNLVEGTVQTWRGAVVRSRQEQRRLDSSVADSRQLCMTDDPLMMLGGAPLSRWGL